MRVSVLNKAEFRRRFPVIKPIRVVEYKCAKCGTVRYYPEGHKEPVRCPKC